MNWAVVALLAGFAVAFGIVAWYGLPKPFDF